MTEAAPSTVDQLQAGPPYALGGEEKRAALMPELDRLTRHHYARCAPYRCIVDAFFGGLKSGPYGEFEELPFVPVSLFKQLELRSVPEEEVFRVLTSSGTSGGAVSRVYVDKETAARQSRALVRIVQHFVGKERLPMVILDHPGVIRDRASFSARGAGILGLMQFGRQPIYAFRDDMSFDREAVDAYLTANSGSPVMFFGFTFMAWKHGMAALASSGRGLPPNRGVLIHSGGWKKLEAERVAPEAFEASARRWLGVDRVVNFYGMVEQVGSVFFETPGSGLRAPVFAHVIARDPFTLKPLASGERGLLQVISVLPGSYPGHSLLTEDIGECLGDDSGIASVKGRAFRVLGRAPQAEIRGCSDTYEQQG
jgi:hypothetical protein